MVVDPSTHPGSSPRVRGAVLCRAGSPAGPGIIPARAGSSCGGFSRLWASRDHPRACGEQAIAAGPRAGYAGSSPRVRGAEAQPHARSDALGIIPARAGSSAHCRCGGQAARDHPRACGEQLRRKVDDFCDVGSSPRVRGAVLGRFDDIARLGIIPARAGSRPDILASQLSRRDHPRACGEQAYDDELMDERPGSSPRVRGAVHNRYGAWTDAGIIPARAGSSYCSRRCFDVPGDHPRACGEQTTCASSAQTSPGSSPRVRGAAVN